MSGSTKDTKKLLKEAKEAIKRHDFKDALGLSNQVLKEDQDNYVALIFLGVSLLELGSAREAEKAFIRATQLNPKNVLGWNALVNYYERLENKEAGLLDAYLKVIDLEEQDNKVLDLCEKLTRLCTDANYKRICKHLFTSTLSRGQFKEETLLEIRECIVSLLMKFDVQEVEFINMMNELLEMLMIRSTKSKTYYGEYLKNLNKLKDYDKLISTAENMHRQYPDDSLSLEWICKIYNDAYFYSDTFGILETNVSDHCEKLLKLRPNCHIGLTTKIVLLMESGKYLECLAVIKTLIAEKPSLPVHYLAIECCLKLHINDYAVKMALEASTLLTQSTIPDETFKYKLNSSVAKAFTTSDSKQHRENGIRMCENILAKHPSATDILVSLGNVTILTGNYTKTLEIIKTLKDGSDTNNSHLLLHGKLLRKQGKFNEALDVLRTNTAYNQNADLLEEMGDIFWELGEFRNSHEPYLKAAKLRPFNYLNFRRLGQFYKHFGDLDKARRCYEKALNMNDGDKSTVLELSKIYTTMKQCDLNAALLKNYVSDGIDSSNMWACVQLGLNYLSSDNFDEAIKYLRLVVRMDPHNSFCWESLGDAYFARGSYTSAQKSYERAAESSESNLYSRLQIASINQVLGHSEEAAQEYRAILLDNHNYVPALKGLSETFLSLSYNYERCQMVGMARDYAQCALDNISEALHIKRNISCLWKIIGDTLIFLSRLPTKYSYAFISNSIWSNEAEEDKDGKLITEKFELLSLATKSYQNAMNLTRENSLLWHDLAVCYFLQANDTVNGHRNKQLIETSMKITQHCTKLNPSNWEHWNLLGLLYCQEDTKNYSAAQHYFLKAVTNERNNPVAWCNLGILYLLLDELQLSNKAFAEAQRADPNYVNSWIGQALIAEKAGHEDAMDLFRHSTQLGVHPEGGIGYAHWVCKTLLDPRPRSSTKVYSIHNMNAISVASDALIWYTVYRTDDACAWNMLGILQGRSFLKHSPAASFRNAYVFASENHKDAARINYARSLSINGDYKRAIQLYSEIQKASFKSGSGLALTYFKAALYEESYEAYQSALDWLTDDESKQSDLLVALAAIAYMFQGPASAKTLLFQSVQLKQPSTWGFFATLALALLHNDQKLARISLTELDSIKDQPECIGHYVTLLSHFYLLQGKQERALKEVSKVVHRHPHQVSVWLTLFQLQLYAYRVLKPSITALKCGFIAERLANTASEVSKALSFSSLALFLVGEKNRAVKTVQKALHCDPAQPEAMAAFAVILRGKKVNS